MMDKKTTLKRNEIIVSVQAVNNSDLQDPNALTRIGLDAIAGGACALRLAGVDTVKLVRSKTKVPIIGLIKTQREKFEPRITCISKEISCLKEAGADIVAIDSTKRARPESIESLYKTAQELDLEIFADVATVEEAKKAMDLGATYLATTMAGYTSDRSMTIGPDFELLRELVLCGARSILEGRVSHSEHLAKALEIGAFAVVIGRAVTSPQTILRGMLQGLRK